MGTINSQGKKLGELTRGGGNRKQTEEWEKRNSLTFIAH